MFDPSLPGQIEPQSGAQQEAVPYAEREEQVPAVPELGPSTTPTTAAAEKAVTDPLEAPAGDSVECSEQVEESFFDSKKAAPGGGIWSGPGCQKCLDVFKNVRIAAAWPLAILVFTSSCGIIVGFIVNSQALEQPGSCNGYTYEKMSKPILFYTVIVHLLALVLVAVPSTWLLVNSPTRSTRSLSTFAFAVWLCHGILALRSVLACSTTGGQDFIIGLLWNMFTTFRMVLTVWQSVLTLRCLRSLERSMCKSFGSSRLMYALVTLFALSIFLAYLGDFMIVGLGMKLGHVVHSVNLFTVLPATMVWLCLVVRPFLHVYRTINAGTDSATKDAERRLSANIVVERLKNAHGALRLQIIGMIVGPATSILHIICSSFVAGYFFVYPGPESDAERFWLADVPPAVDHVANIVFALALSGTFTAAVSAGAAKRKLSAVRNKRLQESAASYKTSDQHGWEEKVVELAGRGLTLEALLQFYCGLGSVYMLNFDPAVNTTADVVHRAVMPLSKAKQSSLATVMMKGVRTRPQKMVTHNWSNLFRDVVAAIIADALDEDEYARISHLLMHSPSVLLAWVYSRNVHLRVYWVDAFSVNQHADGGNPDVFEMSKVQSMMSFLSVNDAKFEQVVAVDEEFLLFSSTCCMSEIAAAHKAGMMQCLKMPSLSSLAKNEDSLKSLKVESTEATRPADQAAILDSIPDKEAFNSNFQHLLFEDLLPAWHLADVDTQMERIGCDARWTALRLEGGLDM